MFKIYFNFLLDRSKEKEEEGKMPLDVKFDLVKPKIRTAVILKEHA